MKIQAYMLYEKEGRKMNIDIILSEHTDSLIKLDKRG